MIFRSNTRRLRLSGKLQPKYAREMLPELTADDVRQMKVSGWARTGIIAAIIDHSGKILMLEHKGSDKSPDGALGPLSETAQLAHTTTGIRVESTAHTLSRAILEELGVKDPQQLGLRARKVGGWILNNWPVGIEYDGQRALAICPVVHIDADAQAELLREFEGTDEIRDIVFMHPQDILNYPLTRPGTHEWLKNVMDSGLLKDSPSKLAEVKLPDPQPLEGGVDIKMHSLDTI